MKDSHLTHEDINHPDFGKPTSQPKVIAEARPDNSIVCHVQLPVNLADPETAGLLASIFPDKLPVEVLLQRVVARYTEPDWVRLRRCELGQNFYIACECCRRTLEDVSTVMFTDPARTVEVRRYNFKRWGICEPFRFWLPVTVWLGVCDRCGTVYWDRD